MKDFDNKNPFNKTYPKSPTRVPTQSKPSKSKAPKSLAEMQKPNKFQLMSKKDYASIKQGIYNKIGDSLKDFAPSDYITNTLNIALISENKELHQVSLISSFYTQNPKIKQICELESYNKGYATYLDKSKQYTCRLEIMQKLHGLLPAIVSPIALELIQEYAYIGFNASFEIEPLQTSLDKISTELWDEFKLSVAEYRKTQDAHSTIS